MNDNMHASEGLPMLGPDGKIPEDLMNHFDVIERASGFAQVYPVSSEGDDDDDDGLTRRKG
jgi:hypothetical protein